MFSIISALTQIMSSTGGAVSLLILFLLVTLSAFVYVIKRFEQSHASFMKFINEQNETYKNIIEDHQRLIQDTQQHSEETSAHFFMLMTSILNKN